MIDWATAWARATEFVAAKRLPEEGDAARIDERYTVEYDFGWVFFYNSKRYLDEGDRRAQLVGNVPFVVDRRDGSVHVMRTNWYAAVSEYSQRYREEVAAGWVDSPAPPPEPAG